MYKLVNSEWNEMNEKQVKLNEFMIAFEKKSSLILISATAVNANNKNDKQGLKLIEISIYQINWLVNLTAKTNFYWSCTLHWDGQWSDD